jgi:crossover junction endodeoxyribonuclease RusA
MSLQPNSVMFRVPFPPTVNHYWRHWRGRMILSRSGRAYRKAIAARLARVDKLHGRLRVTIRAVMPDRRRRDLDNLLKSLLDALEHVGVYDDDGSIDDLRIFRSGRHSTGYLDVRIEELEVRLL